MVIMITPFPSTLQPVAQIFPAGLQAKEQYSPTDEKRQWKFIRGVFSQLKKDCPIFGVLVIGETGTGKSTLINNLLGKEVAPVGHSMKSETLEVTPHEVAVEGVPVVVYDTPGLDDVWGGWGEASGDHEESTRKRKNPPGNLLLEDDRDKDVKRSYSHV